jgi:hypothetical protein
MSRKQKDEECNAGIVRQAGRYSSQDIHRAIFPHGAPGRKMLEEFDRVVRRYMKKKHARR